MPDYMDPLAAGSPFDDAMELTNNTADLRRVSLLAQGAQQPWDGEADPLQDGGEPDPDRPWFGLSLEGAGDVTSGLPSLSDIVEESADDANAGSMGGPYAQQPRRASLHRPSPATSVRDNVTGNLRENITRALQGMRDLVREDEEDDGFPAPPAEHTNTTRDMSAVLRSLSALGNYAPAAGAVSKGPASDAAAEDEVGGAEAAQHGSDADCVNVAGDQAAAEAAPSPAQSFGDFERGWDQGGADGVTAGLPGLGELVEEDEGEEDYPADGNADDQTDAMDITMGTAHLGQWANAEAAAVPAHGASAQKPQRPSPMHVVCALTPELDMFASDDDDAVQQQQVSTSCLTFRTDFKYSTHFQQLWWCLCCQGADASFADRDEHVSCMQGVSPDSAPHNVANQVSKWGFAPGADDTLRLNLADHGEQSEDGYDLTKLRIAESKECLGVLLNAKHAQRHKDA